MGGTFCCIQLVLSTENLSLGFLLTWWALVEISREKDFRWSRGIDEELQRDVGEKTFEIGKLKRRVEAPDNIRKVYSRYEKEYSFN